MENYLIYLRKSRQDDPNETIEEVLARHETQLQEYAIKTFGYRIKENNIYREIVSGETIEDRPQINLIFKRLEDKNITGVLVIEPQRLTRGDMLDCGMVIQLFRYTNTLIITPQKTYNLDDKFDRKFIEMELSRGNDYLEYTKEILMRGRKASQREGNYLGSVAPYGYDKIKIGKSWTLTPNNEAPYVVMAFDMYCKGASIHGIADYLTSLGVKSKTGGRIKAIAIKQMLENPVYIGKIKIGYRETKKVFVDGKLVKKRERNYDCELVDGKHEALISEEVFNKATERKGKCTHNKANTQIRNIFASILRCKSCGGAMIYNTYIKDGVEMRKPRYICRNGKYCNCCSSRVADINDAILKALKGTLNDIEIEIHNNNDDSIKAHKSLINALENELKKIEKKQDELYTFLEDGLYTKEVFKMRNANLSNEREKVTKALEETKQTIPQIEDTIKKSISLHTAIDMINDNTIDNKAKNMFLKDVIEKITYCRERAEDDAVIEIFLK